MVDRSIHQTATCLQYLVIAAPRGCSLLFSAVPTIARSRERGILLPSTTILTWTTSGEPYVMVPVLSNTTDWICSRGDKNQKGWKCVYLYGNTMFFINSSVSLICNETHQLYNQCTLCAISRGSPPFIRMPFCAPTPVPTMTAVGVAKPREQGQAMHNTVMEAWKAKRTTASALEMLLS